MNDAPSGSRRSEIPKSVNDSSSDATIGSSQNAMKSATNGAENDQPSSWRRSPARRSTEGRAPTLAGATAMAQAAIDSACCCISFAPCSGDVPPVVTFSCTSLIELATSSHFGSTGGGLASSSCCRNSFSCGSEASLPWLYEAFTDGRSPTVLNHFAWTSGWERYSTNFHAAGLFFEFSKTARSPPPRNDVRPAVSFGIIATSHLPFSFAPPWSRISARCHGPEKNIGSEPLTKPCVTSKPCGTRCGVRPSSKNDLSNVSALTMPWSSSEKVPSGEATLLPACHANGISSCQLFGASAIPCAVPAFVL